MTGSEGARRMVAIVTVALAVGAQTLATRNVAAHMNAQASHFDVRLLEVELSAPMSPANSLELRPWVPEPAGSASMFSGSLAEPSDFPALVPEFFAATAPLDWTLDRRLRNRDSVGSLIEVTENDSLTFVRVRY